MLTLFAVAFTDVLARLVEDDKPIPMPPLATATPVPGAIDLVLLPEDDDEELVPAAVVELVDGDNALVATNAGMSGIFNLLGCLLIKS